MSRVGVAISVISAAILTLIAAVLYSTPPEADGVDVLRPLLEFDARQADAIEVTTTGGAVTVRRAGRSLNWWITIEEGDSQRVWPASQQAVRAALRLLTELAPIDSDHDGSTFSPEATLTVRGDEGKFAAQLGSRTIAGRGVLRPIGEDAELVTVSSALHDLMLRPGPRAWREPLVFPDLQGATGLSRIGLVTRSESILFARVEGLWWVHPNADLSQRGLRADPRAIDRLIRSIGATRVEQFIDEARHETGLDDPTAVLTLMSGKRDQSGEFLSRFRELRIGQPVGLGAQAIFASLDDSDASDVATDYQPQLVAIDAVALASLAMDPAAYMHPVAVATTDIGEVMISDVARQPVIGVKRTLEGWRHLEGQSLPTTEERDAIDAMVNLACVVEGEPMLAEDVEFAPLCVIELSDLGGALIDTFTFGLVQIDGEERPVLVNEREARLYAPDSAAAALDWLLQE